MTISHRGVQVYQDTVFDLLSETPGQVLAIRQSYDGVKVDNLSELPVQEPRRVAELIKYALKNRAVGGTLLNEVSSRSHMIVCVSVRTTNGLAKLNLVDLAGSERLQVELATNLHKDFTVTEFAPTRAFQSLSRVLLSVIVKSSRRFVASSSCRTARQRASGCRRRAPSTARCSPWSRWWRVCPAARPSSPTGTPS